MAWLSGKAEPVRESLDPGGLANRKGAILLGVDVPVAVLGDVRGDAPAQLVPCEALVLIGEDVAPVASKMVGKILVGLPFLQEREGLGIIGTNVARDVV